MISGHALQPADRHGLAVDAPAPARWLAGPVACAAEDAREDIGLPVHHVRVGVPALCDQPDVFRHICVCRAGPLAVDNLMVVLGIRDVRRTQAAILSGDIALSPPVGTFSRRSHPTGTPFLAWTSR